VSGLLGLDTGVVNSISSPVARVVVGIVVAGIAEVAALEVARIAALKVARVAAVVVVGLFNASCGLE
ncbi:20889_t:CDS:2, partial [Racocetra persica]